jgi:hypothetical protein
VGTITTSDGTEIFYKDWGSASRSCSVTVGPSQLTTGTPRCCSSCAMTTGSLPTTDVGTDAPHRLARVTTWTTMPTTWPH